MSCFMLLLYNNYLYWFVKTLINLDTVNIFTAKIPLEEEKFQDVYTMASLSFLSLSEVGAVCLATVNTLSQTV